MAEVIGAISAVVELSRAGSELTVFLIKFGRAAACPEKVKKILDDIKPEVSLISAVSTQLALTLRDDEIVRVCKFDTFPQTQAFAAESLKSLTDASDILKKFFEKDAPIGFVDRLKMYNVEKKINLIRANLDQLRTKLILILDLIILARNMVKDQRRPSKRENEIIFALKKENREKEIRYQRLKSAITIDVGGIGGQLAKLDFSILSSDQTDSVLPQYSVLNKDGKQIADQTSSVLALKLENISQLITEIEETKRDIAHITQLTEHDGIWETFKKNGVPHYRHTAITIRLNGPGGDSSRGVIDDPYPTQQHAYQPQIPNHEVQITDIYIALMGAIGTGKSTFVNVCLGSYLAPTSQAPGRCTQTVEEYHFMYTNEIKVHLIDTPGFDTHRSEREILTELLDWTKASQGNGGAQKPRLFSGILYFHKITDAKPQLSTHRNIRMLERLCIPTSPTGSIPSSPPAVSSTFDPMFDPTLDPTFYPPSTTSTMSTTSSAYTATSYFSSSTTPSTVATSTTHTTTTASLHPIILVTTNWEYFLGDDDRALQHESDLRTHDDYWGAMIRRGSTVVRYASADQESAMGVLGMLKVLENTRYTGSSGMAPIHPGVTSRQSTVAPPGTSATGSIGPGVGEAGDRRYFPGAVDFGRDDMSFGSFEEPGEYERARALSLTDTPSSAGPASKSIDAEVSELLAEYTTVVLDGPMMPEQHRRWTFDQTP